MITKIDFQLTANNGKNVIYEFIGDISNLETMINNEIVESIAGRKASDKALKFEATIGIWWKYQCNVDFKGNLKELINVSDTLNISCYHD